MVVKKDIREEAFQSFLATFKTLPLWRKAAVIFFVSVSCWGGRDFAIIKLGETLEGILLFFFGLFGYLMVTLIGTRLPKTSDADLPGTYPAIPMSRNVWIIIRSISILLLFLGVIGVLRYLELNGYTP